MSKLDLRTRAGMLKGGEKGPAIVPGNAEASALYRRITSREKPAMPMAPLAGLTASEIVTLKSWIDQGAPWPEWKRKTEGFVVFGKTRIRQTRMASQPAGIITTGG